MSGLPYLGLWTDKCIDEETLGHLRRDSDWKLHMFRTYQNSGTLRSLKIILHSSHVGDNEVDSIAALPQFTKGTAVESGPLPVTHAYWLSRIRRAPHHAYR